MNNMNEAQECIRTLSNIRAAVAEKKELYAADNLYEFDNVIDGLEKNIKIGQESKRELSIGIIGAVKAGKSSFLNALLFDGEEVLPKAATPMTAALTIISYSAMPRAKIHFYSQKDWKIIEQRSSEYDTKLEEKYQEYLHEQEERNARKQGAKAVIGSTVNSVVGMVTGSSRQSNTNERPALTDGTSNAEIQVLSKEEYEKKRYKKEVLEYLQAAKELTDMVSKDTSVLSMLRANEEDSKNDDYTLEGEDMKKLNNYVGADGKYTPIVSYVEYQMNMEALQGLKIIDTPGLNDPIVSRSMVTKEFLSTCDVAILLSPCSQFMDNDTICTMVNTFPNSGIQEILVIGSKLDSGILNESAEDFRVAYQSSLQSYEKQFANNINSIKENGGNNQIIAQLTKIKPLFVSSLLFSISQKLASTKPLNEEESHIFDQLRRRYRNFNTADQYIRKISGIGKVYAALRAVMERKAEIINTKTSELAVTANFAALKILDKIQTEVLSNQNKLENSSAEELEGRYDSIQKMLDSSRRKLTSFFENAALECEKNARNIVSEITATMVNYSNFKTETSTESHDRSYRTGILWLRKETVTTTTTTHTADTAQIKLNIQSYIAKCQTIINNEFNYIINTDKLRGAIKELVIDIFGRSGNDYDENDILIPLESVITRIQIPHISVSANKYIDLINSQFPSGFARNDEIHKLSDAQVNAFSIYRDDVLAEIKVCVADISKLLNTQAVTFADEISGKIGGELSRLKNQISEKQSYIQQYADFAEQLKGFKQQLLNNK